MYFISDCGEMITIAMNCWTLLWGVVVCMCAFSEPNVHVNPNVGTIIKHRGQLNAAMMKLNVIIELENIPELPGYSYPAPCDYKQLFITEIDKHFNLIRSQLIVDYESMCKGFMKIRQANIKFRNSLLYTRLQDTSTIQQLTPRRRNKRFLGNALRSMFGIADRNKQRQMERIMNYIVDKSFTQEGKLNGLDFMVKIQNEQIDALANNTMEYERLMINVTEYVRTSQQKMNGHQLLYRHGLTWIADALTAGVLYDQVIQVHTALMKTRIQALGDLSMGQLSPELVRPSALFKAITDLENRMNQKYRGLEIARIDILEYYGLKDITGYSLNGTIYISIPVRAGLRDQIYDLFDISTFLVPVESNQSQATIIQDHIDLLAVNVPHNSYFEISRNFLENHCMGKNMYHCDRMIVNYDLSNSPRCSTAIYNDNVKAIHGLCNLGLLQIDSNMQPQFIDLYNSSVLLVNPNRKSIYSRCSNENRRKFVTNDVLVTIDINCLCYLFNDALSTPVFAAQHCLNQTIMKTITNNHLNLLYLASVVNDTILENKNMLNYSGFSKLPSINIPKGWGEFILPHSNLGKVYDLKKLISLQHEDTIFGKVTKNTKDLGSFQSFKMIGYGLIGIVIIIVVAGGLLTCRVKGLGQLLALGKLIPVANARPLELDNTECNDDWSISNVITITLCSCLIMHWVYHHIAVLKRCFRYLAFPIREFQLESKRPALSVLLYFHNLKDWSYLNLDLVHMTPSNIQLLQSETDIDIHFNDGWCSSYIIINHKNLGLKVGDELLIFNRTIAVPAYAKFALRTILNDSYKLQVLVGENRIYRAFDVNLKRVDEIRSISS